MKLFRVENRIHHKGLWYHGVTGKKTSFVQALDLSGKNLPMEFDPRISNYQWRSAGSSIEDLKFWFTYEDLSKLIPLGYKLYEIDANIVEQHTTEHYSHPIFQEIGVTSRKELDIGALL